MLSLKSILLLKLCIIFAALNFGPLLAEDGSESQPQPVPQEYQQPAIQGYPQTVYPYQYPYASQDPYAVPEDSAANPETDQTAASESSDEESEKAKENSAKASLPENPISEDESAPVGEFSRRKPGSKDDLSIDFDHEDAFIDQQEAIRTEQYVRRAILSTIVNTTGKFRFNKFYINHLMGFNAVYQQENGPIKFAKYTSGMQGLSLGYITKKGHAFELGLEASAVSNIYGGYRYIWRTDGFTVWPSAGLGIGTEMSSIKLSSGPSAAENYSRLGGMKQMGFATLGLMIPIVEVGIKAEVRAIFYGLDRLILSQGLGLIIFI